jgi:signal transduction histidine kinase
MRAEDLDTDETTPAADDAAGEAEPAADEAAGPPAQLPGRVDEEAPREFTGADALALQIAISALLGFAFTMLWLLTGAGYFWPGWIWTALFVGVAGHAGLRWALTFPTPGERAVGILAALTAVVASAELAAWALSGGGFFWPVFSILALSAATGIVALVVHRHRLLGGGREEELSERVDELTRTRRGALDVQAAELRRIERDLHDGAQARLVALSMKLGRAEERLADEPEAAELVREARTEAGAAIAELRDLARGIAPPVLADRGLPAAVEALGGRSAIPVTVDVDMDRRALPVLETAAYFVVAEGLTNAAKHAGATGAHVTIVLDDERLVVEVHDDGRGGADPSGGGLTGLRHRVEALDGILAVRSETGKGTTIRAELPCGS